MHLEILADAEGVKLAGRDSKPPAAGGVGQVRMIRRLLHPIGLDEFLQGSNEHLLGRIHPDSIRHQPVGRLVGQ